MAGSSGNRVVLIPVVKTWSTMACGVVMSPVPVFEQQVQMLCLVWPFLVSWNLHSIGSDSCTLHKSDNCPVQPKNYNPHQTPSSASVRHPLCLLTHSQTPDHTVVHDASLTPSGACQLLCKSNHLYTPIGLHVDQSMCKWNIMYTYIKGDVTF